MPGPVETDATSDPQMRQFSLETLVPLTRAEEREGRAEDIADVVLLLASEKSRWVTGQTISVSGGITGN